MEAVVANTFLSTNSTCVEVVGNGFEWRVRTTASVFLIGESLMFKSVFLRQLESFL